MDARLQISVAFILKGLMPLAPSLKELGVSSGGWGEFGRAGSAGLAGVRFFGIWFGGCVSRGYWVLKGRFLGHDRFFGELGQPSLAVAVASRSIPS